jgi:type VI secretion system protein ImpH
MKIAMLENIHQYQFQQAVRLLENRGVKHLRYIATPDVTFPGADIKHARQKNGCVTLAANFMGLYGVDSPLPHYLTTLSNANNVSGERIRHYFDVIHQQIYPLFYQAWKKYHIFVQLNNPEHSYYRQLQAISGGLLKDDDKQEYAQAALLGAKVKTASALSTAIRAMLASSALAQQYSVTIQLFQPTHFHLVNMSCLGKMNLILSDNTVLGQNIQTVQNKIQIEIGVMNYQQAEQLTPDQPLAKRLHSFVKRYLKPNMRYELALKVNAAQKNMLQLGVSSANLAWSTYLGEPLTAPYQLTLTV